MKPLLIREKKTSQKSRLCLGVITYEDLVLLSLELMRFRTFERQFRTADLFSIPLMVKATCIMIVQAKYDGSVSPNDSDLAAAKKIWNAGKTVDIDLLDYFVVSTKEYLSMSDKGYSIFDDDSQ